MELNGNSILWFLAIVLLAGGGLGGIFGNNRPIGPAPATIEDVNAAINNQTLQNQLNSLGIETANNNYETARLVQQQTSDMMQQNNTNLINAIQGFNNIALQMQNQTSQLSSKLDQLGYQMENCCCSIKTQNLQHWYEEERAKNVELTNKLDNANQTQTILGNLGRFVAWAGSGTQAVAAAAGA